MHGNATHVRLSSLAVGGFAFAFAFVAGCGNAQPDDPAQCGAAPNDFKPHADDEFTWKLATAVAPGDLDRFVVRHVGSPFWGSDWWMLGAY